MLNEDFITIANWADGWLVILHPNKTNTFLVSRKREPSNTEIGFNIVALKDESTQTHLGLTFATWGDQINKIYEKAAYRLYLIRLLNYDLDRKSLTRFYMTYIRPILEYAGIIWDICTKTQSDLLESINLEAVRIISGLRRGTSQAVLYRELGWTSLAERRSNSKLIQLYKILNDGTPTYLSDILFRYNQHDPGYEFRNRNTDLKHPTPRTASFQNSFFISTIDLWNNLNDDIKNSCTSLYSFKKALTKHITPPPSYFIHGERKYNIIMCQLRNRKKFT